MQTHQAGSETVTRTTAPEWKRRRERSTPGMVAFIIWVALALGRPVARALLVPIAAYFLLTAGSARRALRTFFKRATRQRASLRDLYCNIYSFAACTLDRVILSAGRQCNLQIKHHGDTAARDRIHAGGAIVLTSHLGSFDILRVYGKDRHDLKFRIIMDAGHTPLVTQALARINPTLADEIIDASSGPALGLEIREAINQGCLVGIMADRLIGNDPGLTMPFMGVPARLPTQPWRWAAVLGVPVMLCFGIYRGGNRYDLYFEVLDERYTPVPRSERDAYIANGVARYAARLAHHAANAPCNWFNFHDFWADETG